MNIKESNSTAEENKSITLRTSPVKIKSPFIKRSPEQNRINGRGGEIPNIISKRVRDAIRSIPPSILTKTI